MTDSSRAPTSDLPPYLLLPGMTSKSERRYLHDFVRDRYTGGGAIVDLGSWLGSLVASLAEGLRENPQIPEASRVIHAYDLFRFDPWMTFAFVDAKLPIPRPGETFLPMFQQLTSPWGKMIRTYEQDCANPTWHGEPIEILVVDVMKNWELANAVLRVFFPHLIVGKGIVAHQDITHFGEAWIWLIMHRLREYFEVVDAIPGSCNIVFRLARPIPTKMLTHQYQASDFSAEEVDAAHQWVKSIALGEQHSQLDASRIIHDLISGQVDRASQALPDLLADPRLGSDVKPRILRRWVDSHPGLLTFAERQNLFQRVTEDYRGEGVIVDLGCLLGASTVILSEAARRKTDNAVVEVCETFRFESWMSPTFDRHGLPKPTREGNSYSPLVRQLTSPWAGQIRWMTGEESRSTEHPIELLHLSATHCPSLARETIDDFLARLMPGHSRVIVRDVKTGPPWMVTLFHRLRECFDEVKLVDNSETLSLKCVKRLDKGLASRSLSPQPSPQELSAAIGWATGKTP